MKSFKLFILSAAVLAAVSCSKTARIDFTAGESPETDIVLKKLDVNVFSVLDTVKTDDCGHFVYKVDVAEAQPEFVYIFNGETKLASIVILPGDVIKVVSDSKGSYEVEGSEESSLLKEVETNYASFLSDIMNMTSSLDGNLSNAEVDRVNKMISRRYVDYYRNAMKFLLTHPYSIASVPLCFQNVNPSLPVFNQITDAIQFRNVADSLMTVYPESKYVKALQKEAARRENLMKLKQNIDEAVQSDFPDLNLPSMNGEKVAISDIKSKAVLVYFWTSSEPAQKIVNIDVIKPVYKEFHDRGLEIYAVDITSSKSEWAATVRNQSLPWINVCDGLGLQSPSLASYNVGKLPVAYLLCDGEMSNVEIGTVEKLRNILNSKLK